MSNDIKIPVMKKVIIYKVQILLKTESALLNYSNFLEISTMRAFVSINEIIRKKIDEEMWELN